MSQATNHQSVIGLLTVGLACAGCENGTILPPPFEARPEHLLGSWKLESGQGAFSYVYASLIYHLTYVEIRDGGKATLFGRSEFDVVADFPVTYTAQDDTVTFESEAGAFEPIVLTSRMSNADSLSMRDTNGDVTHFKREAFVPAEARCLPLYRVRTHTYDVIPYAQTGLVYVDHRLLFSDEYGPAPGDIAEVYSIDPNDGMIVQLPSLQTDHRLVQSMQSGDTWRTCHCYTYSGLQRFDPNGVMVDQFDIESDLDTAAEIASVAYDPSTALLWVSSVDATAPYRLIGIDTQVDPFIARMLEPFHPLQGLASDGTSLWGLSQGANVLVRIDPVAGVPVQSFHIPSRDIRWFDVEFVDGRIFLIGEDLLAEKGVLMELSRRRLPLDVATDDEIADIMQ